MDVQQGAFIEQKFVWKLNGDAGAVAAVVLTSAGAAVFHVFQNSEGIRYGAMILVTPDVSYKTYSA